MSINIEIKKRMVELNIEGAVRLSELTGLSYAKTLRILKGDGTVRLKDVVTTASALGLEFKFIVKEKSNE